MIMDLLLFMLAKWGSLLMDIDFSDVATNLVFLSIFSGVTALISDKIA